MSVEKFSFLILDFLFKSSDFSVMNICSSWILVMYVVQFFIQFTNKLSNLSVEFIEDTTCLHVELTKVQDEISPTRTFDLGK